jgi:hypothetical protein
MAAVSGRIDGWWNASCVLPGTDSRSDVDVPSVLVARKNLTKPAMLAHRPGELSLDNAFAFIEGHLSVVVLCFGKRKDCAEHPANVITLNSTPP